MGVKFYYDFPKLTCNENGNIEIFHKYSVAPIEAFTYGITKEREFFLEWEYSIMGDDELETDYRVISKERLIKDISFEIERCNDNGNIDVASRLERILNDISSY